MNIVSDTSIARQLAAKETMEKAFYRVSEVAEIIGLGKSLTYRLVAEGKIPSVWLAGCRSRRVSAKALTEWIERQSQNEMRID